MKNTHHPAQHPVLVDPALIQAPADFRKILCEIKANYYLCSVFYTAWRVWLAELVGFFYALNIRFRTPVWSVNAPTAMLVEDNGTGETVFIFCHKV